MAKQPAQFYQIKVTLNNTRPPIWRRFRVAGDTPLQKLHDVLQTVMGWQDYHLHNFIIDGVYYGDPENDEYGDQGIRPERNYKLRQVVEDIGARILYEYDFGDGWQHTLVVENVGPPEPGERLPVCLAGKRACPPEDVGGVYGYEEFLKAIRDRRHPDHAMYTGWIGGDFDPEAFDLEQVNANLRRMGRGPSAQVDNPWLMIANFAAEQPALPSSSWLKSLPDDQKAAAENLPLRRDVLTLLAYLRDHRITGTQSTGNLPLKAVREICASFVDPPILDEKIGETVLQTRSEAEVWPLYFAHMLAAMAGLVAGGPARRWRLTAAGEAFLAASAPQQVWPLFATWWTRVNWAMAFQWSYGDGQLPIGFRAATLKRILALEAEQSVAFEPFADRLITDGGLVWRNDNPQNARNILHALVLRTVIYPLRDFGVLIVERGPKQPHGPEYSDPIAIRLTSVGKGLLTAIEAAMG